jgi:hypothetical protein
VHGSTMTKADMPEALTVSNATMNASPTRRITGF